MGGAGVGWGLAEAVAPLGLILFIGPCEIFFYFSSFQKSLSSVSICWNSAYLPFPLILPLKSVMHRPQMVFACIYMFPANIMSIQFAIQRITWCIRVISKTAQLYSFCSLPLPAPQECFSFSPKKQNFGQMTPRYSVFIGQLPDSVRDSETTEIIRPSFLVTTRVIRYQMWMTTCSTNSNCNEI